MSADILFWSEGLSRTERWERNGHKGSVVWLTGLSGAGKSTIARQLERELFGRNFHPVVLDGDNLRRGLNSDLKFSQEDRRENIRRIAEVGALLASVGNVAIVALISPYRASRGAARKIAHAVKCDFLEVFVDASLSVCEARDPKNLYRRARAGEIRDFTGVNAPYEPPEHPEIHVPTGDLTADACVALILDCLIPRLRLERA